MTKFYLLISFCFLTFVSGGLYGQQGNTKAIKTKTVRVNDCQIELDSLTIAPGSLIIITQNDTLKNGFRIINNSILFEENTCNDFQNQFFRISYRTLPFNIEQKYFHLDSTMMVEEDRAIYIGSDYNFAPKGQEIIDAKGLDYNGSFSRGFSVGNSQSLVLNSNFNLQLTGDLGNGINVVAAISDDNIPIQPEGNTQLIQEFDRVFIKISKAKTSVIAGDYNLVRPNSYFMNYFKKLQGLYGETEFDMGNNRKLTTNANFAVSRGKFARQILDNREGNQGPYKLVGANGERFLIVLSGSEKVFLDGRLLTRGLDYDYIIDYNRAEITFTPNRLIGREHRIIVEYEYRVQNYLRSVYAANAYYSSPKYDLNFNFYNEQDSKTATGDLVLDSTDIQLLSSIGDDISQANIASINLANDTTLFVGQIRYRKNPDVIPPDTSQFFLEYSTDFSEDLFVANFSEVGNGQGRYVIDDETNVNGRVYKYVGPGNGLYEPITSLIPPEKKQIMSFGGKARPIKNMNIATEFSVSNNDINRFSTNGNANNIGTAGVLKFQHSINIGKSKNWQLTTDNFYEYVDKNYLPLNPYRTAEFARDWNLPTQIVTGQQDVVNASLALAKKDSFLLKYSYKSFNINDAYTGVNQKATFNLLHKGLDVQSKIDLLTSEGYGEKTTFIRPLFNVSQLIQSEKDLRLGVRYEVERNERINLDGSESLLKSSFAFDLLSVYLKNGENQKLHYKVQFSDRNDLFADTTSNQLIKSIKTREISTTARWKISSTQNLSFNFGWRDFQVSQPDLLPIAQSSKKTIIGKLDHNFQAMRGFFVSNTNYLINSGQEPKVEFFFERVEEGQGDYIYLGNPDSTLINANFRYAPNQGNGNYIRLSLINNEFITTNNQSLSQTLRIDPRRYLSKRKDELAKLASRFSTISTFRITKKIEENEASSGAGFLNFSSSVDNLVSYNSLISNTLFFNRGNPDYDLQVGNKVTEIIFTQISGLEQRNVNEYFGRARIKILKSTDVLFNYKNGKRGYTSMLNSFRDLDIDYYSINPEISYRPSNNVRINILYTYIRRDQKIGGMEFANSHDFTLNTTIRQASSSNLNFSLSFVNVTFDGEANSPLEFDLLEGLKDGRNYLWNVLYTKRLSNSIDLNISYEGRKTGDAPTLHIARAQIKATF